MKEQLQLMNHSIEEDGKTEGHFLVEHTLECTHSREIYKQTDEIKTAFEHKTVCQTGTF